jgi:hypothetical protein
MLTGPALDNTKVGARIFSLQLVVAFKFPEVPVIIRVLDPKAAELSAVSVNVL